MIPSEILLRVLNCYNRSNVHLNLRTVGDENKFNSAAAKPLLLCLTSSLNLFLKLCDLGLD
jgi:hypothetical protein